MLPFRGSGEEAMDIMLFGGSGFEGFRSTSQPTHAARRQNLELEYDASQKLSALFPLQPSGDRSCLSLEKTRPLNTFPFPGPQTFLQNHIKPSPSLQTSLMTIFHPDTVAKCPKIISVSHSGFSQDGILL
jgi:hypothetical protein